MLFVVSLFVKLIRVASKRANEYRVVVVAVVVVVVVVVAVVVAVAVAVYDVLTCCCVMGGVYGVGLLHREII